MTSWAEGYVSDVAYSVGYYREMAPDHLAFAALSIGKSPGLSLRPERVLELGFGMGLGFVLGAATRPETIYEGCDFNPEHIVHARRLADAAGLTNVIIREASFQELAAEATEGQHDVDIIQLHGILTWVSAEAHSAIIEIARKRLKPGGLLYVSYNCMPGWAPMLPVQRLMREHANRHGGASGQKTTAAITAIKALAEGQARFFVNNPIVAPRLEKLGKMQPSYLAHEYFNENWFIFHMADVARMMGEAKLGYLASASIVENIDSIAVPAEMHKTVGEATDSIWKETLKDFASNKQFRRDIYARGTAELNNIETLVLLNNLQFTLAMPRNAITFVLPGPLGDLNAKAELYGPVADLMADRIVSFGEFATLPALQQVGLPGTLQALALMVNAGQVLPIWGVPNQDLAPAQRLNRQLTTMAEQGRVYNFVAAPVVRSALPAPSTDIFALSGVYAGLEADAAGLTAHVLSTMQRLGIKPLKDGETVTEPAAIEKFIGEQMTTFISEKLPLWRRLGVL